MTGTTQHDENSDNRDDDLLAKLANVGKAKVGTDMTRPGKDSAEEARRKWPKRHGKESAEEEKEHLFEAGGHKIGDDRSRNSHDSIVC